MQDGKTGVFREKPFSGEMVKGSAGFRQHAASVADGDSEPQKVDGGISLPIAYQRAMDLGYEKVVLVLTRNKGSEKAPEPDDCPRL